MFVKKISSVSWAIQKLRNYVDISTLKIVYYSLIYSHLQYCILTWGMSCKTDLNSLITMHKRMTKFIPVSSFNISTSPMMKEINF